MNASSPSSSSSFQLPDSTPTGNSSDLSLLHTDPAIENDRAAIENVNHQAAIPLLSSTRPSSCSDFIAAIGERRRRRELMMNHHGGRQEQVQQTNCPQEGENLTDTTTTNNNSNNLSRKSLFFLRPVHKYVDLVCISLSVLAYLLETTMNAALAIFGIGVGVGLVLGDSFRATLPMAQQHQQQQQPPSTPAPPEIPTSLSNLLPAQ